MTTRMMQRQVRETRKARDKAPRGMKRAHDITLKRQVMALLKAQYEARKHG